MLLAIRQTDDAFPCTFQCWKYPYMISLVSFEEKDVSHVSVVISVVPGKG